MRLKLNISDRSDCHNVEIQNKILKTFVLKRNLDLAFRWSLSKRFLGFLNNQSRLNNRCSINGKSRSVWRCLRLNRLVIASYTARGFIKGVYKGSW